MNEVIGYARVSTGGQDLRLQLDALQGAGVNRVFSDVGSGSLRSRPQLDACLERLGAGDTLIVWRLDRLGRSLRHLLAVLAELSERSVAFRSLTEAVDTTTAAGRLQVHLFAALAEFERSLGQERTRAGLEAARARGRTGGRPIVVTSRKLVGRPGDARPGRPHDDADRGGARRQSGQPVPASGSSPARGGGRR